MKKLAIFLMVLSASMFTLGCQPGGAAKPKDEKKAGAGAPETPPAGGEKPAEPAPPK